VGVACRMQDHEQKWRPLKERVGYLNPYLINQRAMTFELQKDDAAKLDAITDKKERAKALYDMKKDHNAHFIHAATFGLFLTLMPTMEECLS